MSRSESLRMITIRKTPIVIRCPHCGRLLRLTVGLIEDDRKVPKTKYVIEKKESDEV
jgi:phage FluMu protein Com